MLEAYFDESGTDAGQPVMTLAGYIAPASRWQSFGRQWKTILDEFGITEFKAADWQNSTREFKGWPNERRHRLRALLVKVIDKRGRFGLSVSVSVPDYEQIVRPRMPRLSIYQDPYVWCMQNLLEKVMTDSHSRPGEVVSCVFDKGHARQGKAEQYFYEMIDRHRWGDKVVRSFKTADSAQVTPLQAADWIAYETRKERANQAQGKWRRRTELTRLLKRVPVWEDIFTGEILTRIISDCGAEALAKAFPCDAIVASDDLVPRPRSG